MNQEEPKPDPPKTAEPQDSEWEGDDALFEQAMQGELTDVSEARRPKRDFSDLEAKARRLEAKSRRLEASDKLFRESVENTHTPLRDAPAEAGSQSHLTTQGILRRLHSGLLMPDLQVDLHGRTLADALLHLQYELKSAMTRGDRSIVVITGKGLHSNGRARIRDAAPGWLQKECAEWVEGVGAAPRRLGGEGALLVVLRRAARTRNS